MRALMIALGAVVAVGVMIAPLGHAQTAPAGQVWSTGKTYHCPGTRWFKTTKTGDLMTEAAARAKGASPARGKTCAEVAAAAKAKAAPTAAQSTTKGGAKKS